MSKHTPGQWEGRHNDVEGTHVIAGDYIVCEQIDRDADARLIAAAPELAEALRVALAKMIDYAPITWAEEISQAHAALAKAGL